MVYSKLIFKPSFTQSYNLKNLCVDHEEGMDDS